MNRTETDDWGLANQRYLMASLAVVREALERRAGLSQGGVSDQVSQARRTLEEASQAMPAPPALETLCRTFGLSPFERDVLVLCAGVELDSGFAALCAAAQGDPNRTAPTFSLALSALPNPHWSALTPEAMLRHWRLIELGSSSSLTLSPLRIDEWVLHSLTGTPHLDERLIDLVDPMRPVGEMVPSHAAIAERIAAAWLKASGQSALPAIQLSGDEVSGKRAIAAAACASVGLSLWMLPVHYVPTGACELETFVRLWSREAALGATALLVDCDDLDASEAGRSGAAARLINRLTSPLLVTSRERRLPSDRLAITFNVSKPGPAEQLTVWQQALGDAIHPLNGHVEQLVTQFNLSSSTIRAACAETLTHFEDERTPDVTHETAPAAPAGRLSHILWDSCRIHARPRLEGLARQIEPAAGWDDLVLPEPQLITLREIAAHVRHRSTVYEQWGFAAKGSRGLGISALFAGTSGTGKTMAAEVLASELRLDLFRIDLSAVVSKYIGETEKNLRRVFDAAEEGGAILLFDEADALFGKRSEVKDSHDRYANIEVSYLLQRMEAYRGLAILTTNLKNSLDTAFLRRIRFIVQFPFPDAVQREGIWRRIFPQETPTDGLDVVKLSRLNVAGGHIRNIALNAAFLAADAGEPVRMPHLLLAARSEYTKLEKPLTESEIRGWT